MNRYLQFFMHYGLVVAILVWAATVAMMAYHLTDSPWRWAFVALAVGGIATVAGIFKIRKYIDQLARATQPEKRL